MKKDNIYKKGDIAKVILKSLFLGGMIIAIVALPGMASVLNLFQDNNKKNRRKIQNALFNLKKQRLIKIYYKNGEEFVEITEKGKKKLLKYEFDDMKIETPRKWDGLWRIIIFDIPEKRKKARNALNIKLKELGFYRIQKSTFIFPYKCRNEIDFVAEHFFIRKYINYIIAKEIDNADKLKKIFKI